MLAKLFGSNARVKILKLFIHRPDEKFYIRQLARNLQLQLNSVRRELENMEQFGLLISEYSSNNRENSQDSSLNEKKAPSAKKNKNENLGDKQEKKFYRVNKDFVLFEEIKDLIIRSQILYERDFIDKITATGKLRLFLLTGFFSGCQESPIDLLLVGQVNKPKVYKIIKDLENELGREVNFTIMSSQEFKYRRDMTDVFLYNILEGKKIVILDEIGINS